MESTVREKQVERIRKLLEHCLGNGTSTEEADTARLLARKLMATHRVSFDEVTRTCQRQGQENETGAAPRNSAPGLRRLRVRAAIRSKTGGQTVASLPRFKRSLIHSCSTN